MFIWTFGSYLIRVSICLSVCLVLELQATIQLMSDIRRNKGSKNNVADFTTAFKSYRTSQYATSASIRILMDFLDLPLIRMYGRSVPLYGIRNWLTAPWLIFRLPHVLKMRGRKQALCKSPVRVLALSTKVNALQGKAWKPRLLALAFSISSMQLRSHPFCYLCGRLPAAV